VLGAELQAELASCPRLSTRHLLLLPWHLL